MSETHPRGRPDNVTRLPSASADAVALCAMMLPDAEVPVANVKRLEVWRQSPDGRGWALLPLELDPLEDDRVALAAVVGGGTYKAQARGHNGRYVPGAVVFTIEGKPRPLASEAAGEDDADDAAAPAPVAAPPGVDPLLAWMFAQQQSQMALMVRVMRESQAATAAAAQRYTDREATAAAKTVDIAVAALGGGGGGGGAGAALQVLQQANADLRAELARLSAKLEEHNEERVSALLRAERRAPAPSGELAPPGPPPREPSFLRDVAVDVLREVGPDVVKTAATNLLLVLANKGGAGG